jgi:hypothetical protein
MKKSYLFAGVLLASFVPVCVFNSHPAIIRWFFGSSRVLTPPIGADVYVDQQLRTGARCFKVERSFEGNKPIDMLVLYLPEKKSASGRIIVVIDKEKNDIGVPNSSIGCYDLILNKYLFQGGGSEAFVSFADDLKGWGSEPDLKISKESIRFNTPAEWVVGGKNILIRFR